MYAGLQAIPSTLRGSRRGESGTELVEFAFVLPLFLGLLLALIWFGQAFNAYATMTRAAREGARAGVAPNCGSCGNAFDDTKVADSVTTSLQASHIDLTALKSYVPPGTKFCTTGIATGCTIKASNINVCRGVLLNASSPSSDPQQCGVLVSFAYKTPFTFLMNTSISSVLNLPSVTLSTSAQMFQEQ